MYYRNLKRRRKLVKKYRKKKVVQKFGIVFISGLFFLSCISVFSSLAAISYLRSRAQEIVDTKEVIKEVPLATQIYDRHGTPLFRLQSDISNSDLVKQEEITPQIKAAFLAAEDANFYNHNGIDTEAIIRCAYKIASKGETCGASTITQQLVKIQTKKNDMSLNRKIDEMLLATRIEDQYTKDEILRMYLNVTPYGSNITGIKTAAKFYFGIEDLTQLNLSQAVTLAAIVNDPVDLSPTLSSDIEQARADLAEREQFIYDQLTEKYELINSQISPDASTVLTSEMIVTARNTPVAFVEPNKGEIKAGHFVNYTINELQKRNYKNGQEPFTLEDLRNGGYKIVTSLDYGLQEVAERYVSSAGNQTYWNIYNAAVMTTIPSTGEIITMAGSKSFTGQSEACNEMGRECKFNPEVNVLTSLQSPGSTNKPLAYYLAFEQGKLFPGSFLPDVPIQIGGYTPKNWDGSFRGVYNTTAKEMLRQSRNIPALEVILAVGVERYLDMARAMGYTSYGDNSNYGPSVALGGADVYPVEHVQAYGVFANGGDLVRVNPILRIEDRYGNIVYQANPQRERVADPAAVYLLNQTLYNYETGTGGTIAWDYRDIAGKTGTTEENKDSLLVIYSPDFVTLGWTGNNNNEPLDPWYGWPGFTVAPWMREYMAEINNMSSYFSNKTPFTRPDNVYYGGGDCDAMGQCRGVRADWLIAGREPVRGDIGYGKAGSKNTWVYRMPVAELQWYLDRYLSGVASL